MPKLRVSLLVIISVAVIGVVGVFLNRAPNEGPAEPVWEHHTCALCGMHISEKPFAAQLQPEKGGVFYYDDPGCLVLDQEKRKLEGDIYFHHVSKDEWLAADEAMFKVVPYTPMGYGYAAVGSGEDGSMTYQDMRTKILTKRAGKNE